MIWISLIGVYARVCYYPVMLPGTCGDSTPATDKSDVKYSNPAVIMTPIWPDYDDGKGAMNLCQKSEE
jgi:hypothetical protein